MELVVRTTGVVSNSCPLILLPLETVDGNESQPSSPGALPRARIPMKDRREHTNPWLRIPNLFRQELSLQNPPKYIEGDILRDAPLVHIPQTMLPKREACGVQTKLGND